MKRGAPAVLAVLVTFSSEVGTASQGEHLVEAWVGYARLNLDRPSSGMAVGLGYRYGLSDDFEVFGRGHYASFLGPGERCDLMGLTAGVSYLVDALSFVPRIGVGIGYVGPVKGSTLLHDIAVEGEIGLEYRRYRDFGVGVELNYGYLVRNHNSLHGIFSFLVLIRRYF